MRWPRRRIGYFLIAVTGVTALFTLLYAYGMAAWEGRPRGLLHSLSIVVQTFTTTGFGEDAPWSTPQMEALLILMQVTGVGLILTAADVFVVPLLRDALSTTPPGEVEGLEDHVVIGPFTERTRALVDELDSRGVDYVLVEPDEETALDLQRDGHAVVHGDPASVDVLENAAIGAAFAVVADASEDAGDETGANVTLAARSANADVRVVTLVEDRSVRDVHRLAGADEVLSPRQLVGESLGAKVTTTVTDDVGDTVELGSDVVVAEVTVQRGSEACDSTLAESGLADLPGVTVVGAWVDGELTSPVPPDATLGEHTVLLVAGEESRLAELKSLTRSRVRRHVRGPVVIAGIGQAGSAAAEVLEESAVPVTGVDLADSPEVDLQGDVTDPETLREAGLEDAQTLIVALGDDDTAVFTTLLAQDVNPDVEILVRANRTGSVPKLYRAGADYVLALATTSGRMLASTLLGDEEVLPYDRQLRMTRVSGEAFAGQTLAEADVRGRTGCVVVAVERGSDVIVPDEGTFEIRADDSLVVAGTDERVSEFLGRFG